ncbi:hypothetical protein AGMMS50293_03060 [Spirochaetia bacterium]|nr:hypothetical protein AGMMS50293_03060 [Spirochaetia bacterium]
MRDEQGSRQGKLITGTILLCLAGTAANYGLMRFSAIIGTGLFLDTAFTIAVTFAGGLTAGIITAVLSTAISGIGWYSFWGFYLFGLCSIATAVLTYIFIRRFSKEPDPGLLDRIIMLVLLSLGLCALMSVLGGIIAVFIQRVLLNPIDDPNPETYFKLGLLKNGLGLAAAEILARIPVNIVDRFVSVFTGYGAAWLLARTGFLRTK